MEKPILLVAFDTLGSFLVIIIILKTRFFRNIEDTIIANHISARDIVSYSNCRFGKRRQKICLMDIVISSFFPMPESN